MLQFATEFPVVEISNRAAFVAEVLAWLRGTTYSQVLSASSDKELDTENAYLRSDDGEELRFRELSGVDGWAAVGFRHDLPDSSGRLWRTEGVLRRAGRNAEQDLVRIRTQCIATVPGARLEYPRKPYLIKSLVANKWGAQDKEFPISDQPIWLTNTEEGVSVACDVSLGDSSNWLPIVYISATGDGEWLLEKDEIEKLAYELGGVAHVVVEPGRSFSFQLRDQTNGRNAYDGTIGLSIPGRGIIRKYYIGWQNQEKRELVISVIGAAASLRSQMPSFGWDWTELQERALRAQHASYKNSLSAAESEDLFNSYISQLEDLQNENRQLRSQLSDRVVENVGANDGEFSSENLVRRIGPEIYSGEISDRLRYAAKIALSVSDQVGVDERSKAVFDRISNRLPVSPALNELLQDLRRATKDPKRSANEVTSLLRRHGYKEKSDNKHIRLEAIDKQSGLSTITIGKTPSEKRGLKNLVSQIENALGITKL